MGPPCSTWAAEGAAPMPRRCSHAGRVRLVAVDMLARRAGGQHRCRGDVRRERRLRHPHARRHRGRHLVLHPARARRRRRGGRLSRWAGLSAPGGVTMHLVPGRYSLVRHGRPERFRSGHCFACSTRSRPESKGVVEFPVIYDDCWPQALERDFQRRRASRRWTRGSSGGRRTTLSPSIRCFLLLVAFTSAS